MPDVIDRKPLIMAGEAVEEGKPLTIKQRAFALAFFENGGNGQKAAEVAYDVKNSNVARAIAPEVLAKPSVRDEIRSLMVASGLTVTAVLGVHRRNMFQEQNLSVSQTAVKDYYNVVGALSEDKGNSDVSSSFVQLNLTLGVQDVVKEAVIHEQKAENP